MIFPKMYPTRQDVIEKLLSKASSSSMRGGGGGGSSSNGSNLSAAASNGHDRSIPARQQKSWLDAEQMIEDNLREVYEKLPSLEKQIWGKLIIMEGERRTAKAYLRHPVISIDGSDAEFDGMRIGISRFENCYRQDVVYEIFNEMTQGVKIKIDPDGNVWAKRMCLSPVFLKPLYRTRPRDLFIISQNPVKVFDISRFKEILLYEMQQPRPPDIRKLEKCCLICLKFSIEHYDLLNTPSYILLIHLVAIELLNHVISKDKMHSSLSYNSSAGRVGVSTAASSSSSHSASIQRPAVPKPFFPSSPSSFASQFDIRGSNEADLAHNAHHLDSFATQHSLPPTQPTISHWPRASGRAVSKGGVFKRIIRKEEEMSRSHNFAPFTPSYANYRPMTYNTSSQRIIEVPVQHHNDRKREFDGVDGDSSGFDRFGVGPVRHPADKDYASMLDLRQISSSDSPTRSRPFAANSSGGINSYSLLRDSAARAAQGQIGAHRIFSMEDLLIPERPLRDRTNLAASSAHLQNGAALFSSQMERMRLSKKWRSQDSGLGSGSNGSK